MGATIVGAVIGVLIGLLAGYFGGWLDVVLMRFMDGMFSYPFILLAMILITVLGNGIWNVILAIGIANVPSFARVTRGQVVIVKEEEYCNACRVVGVSDIRLLFLHILPNCVSQIIVYATLRVASAIISEASLSFLGLGIALPTASWGSILRVGRECLTTAPPCGDDGRTLYSCDGNRIQSAGRRHPRHHGSEDEAVGGTSMSENNDVILKVEGLKTYFYQASGVTKAVDGVSFTLKQGETMGIVGESGSGRA